MDFPIAKPAASDDARELAGTTIPSGMTDALDRAESFEHAMQTDSPPPPLEELLGGPVSPSYGAVTGPSLPKLGGISLLSQGLKQSQDAPAPDKAGQEQLLGETMKAKGEEASGKPHIGAYNHATEADNASSIDQSGLRPGGLGGESSGGQASAGTFVSKPGQYVPSFSRNAADIPVFSAAKPNHDSYYAQGVSGIFPGGTRPLREAASGPSGDKAAYNAQFPFTRETAHGAKVLYQNNGHNSVTSSPQAESRLLAEYSEGFPNQAPRNT